MIIFNHELLFVHNPKTAGSSMLAWFSEALEGVRTAGVKELGTNHPSLSLSLGYACAMTGNRPEDFRRLISVVRAPVERERSMYSYFRLLADTSGTSEQLNDPIMWRIVQRSAELDCNAYMLWLEQEFGTCDTWSSRCYFRTAEGRVPPNLRVLHFNKLDEELAIVMDGISMKNPAARLGWFNSAEPYNVPFDEQSIDFIMRSYAWQRADRLL